jgi:anti-sigma factor RsiW
MRCEAVKGQLTAYAAGELLAEAHRAVKAHLAECQACRAEMARVDVSAGVLAGVQTPPVPLGFASRVLAVADERQRTGLSFEQTPRRWRWFDSAPMRAAAAVAAFTVGSWGATELSTAKPTEAGRGSSQPAADSVVRDWFEAVPEESFASRYLEAINPNVDGEE